MGTPITLRPAEDADEPFLFALYKTMRGPEFAQVPLLPEQLEMLFTMQYQARKGSYHAAYPASQNSIVLSGEVPAGQIWVDRTSDRILVVDVSLLPEFQGAGIGTSLIQDVITQAHEIGIPVTCSVATNNPGSLRFHQRLGFAITGQDAMYYDLEYRHAS